MLPFAVKNIASIIAASFNWFCAFLILTIFLNYVSLYYIYLIFGSVCFICAIFAAVFLPETKGKSFQEIENLFLPPASP